VFISREKSGDDPWLTFKVRAFVVGAGFALAGIYFDSEWLVGVAIVALMVGFAARFFPAGEGEEAEVGERPVAGAPEEAAEGS